MKKNPGNMILFHMCNINEDHLIYGSWNIRHHTENFCHFGSFFTFSSPWQSGKSKFWKIWRNTWRYYHFTHAYHKWQSYDAWFLIYGAQQTEYFVILDCFLSFYLPSALLGVIQTKMEESVSDFGHLTWT